MLKLQKASYTSDNNFIPKLLTWKTEWYRLIFLIKENKENPNYTQLFIIKAQNKSFMK